MQHRILVPLITLVLMQQLKSTLSEILDRARSLAADDPDWTYVEEFQDELDSMLDARRRAMASQQRFSTALEEINEYQYELVTVLDLRPPRELSWQQFRGSHTEAQELMEGLKSKLEEFRNWHKKVPPDPWIRRQQHEQLGERRVLGLRDDYAALLRLQSTLRAPANPIPELQFQTAQGYLPEELNICPDSDEEVDPLDRSLS